MIEPCALPFDHIRELADPATREREARRAIEQARALMAEYAAVRAEAVQELKKGQTWAQVAELLGVSEATAWNIAHPK